MVADCPFTISLPTEVQTAELNPSGSGIVAAVEPRDAVALHSVHLREAAANQNRVVQPLHRHLVHEVVGARAEVALRVDRARRRPGGVMRFALTPSKLVKPPATRIVPSVFTAIERTNSLAPWPGLNALCRRAPSGQFNRASRARERPVHAAEQSRPPAHLIARVDRDRQHRVPEITGSLEARVQAAVHIQASEAIAAHAVIGAEIAAHKDLSNGIGAALV